MPAILENALTTTLPEEGGTAALMRGFAMIVFSEIGDKTFLIAAILAMRHPRLVVFGGAFGSLLVMSVLSAELGHLLPSLVPKKWTQVAAAALFLVFGFKMFVEAKMMKGGSEEIQEEMKEAEEEIEEDEGGEEEEEEDAKDGGVEMKELEEGKAKAKEKEEKKESKKAKTKVRSVKEGLRNFCSLFFGPVFVQAFVLTFLGEWGDRSQIATIALGAAHNVYLVSFGTIVGHSCCTGLAVIGGKYVSTKISVQKVTYGGSFLFLLFGMIYLYEAFMTVDIPIPLSTADIL